MELNARDHQRINLLLDRATQYGYCMPQIYRLLTNCATLRMTNYLSSSSSSVILFI